MRSAEDFISVTLGNQENDRKNLKNGIYEAILVGIKVVELVRKQKIHEIKSPIHFSSKRHSYKRRGTACHRTTNYYDITMLLYIVCKDRSLNGRSQ